MLAGLGNANESHAPKYLRDRRRLHPSCGGDRLPEAASASVRPHHCRAQRGLGAGRRLWRSSPLASPQLRTRDLSILPDRRQERLMKAKSIALIGSGLTMIDALIGARRDGFSGIATIVSRRGQLPRRHAAKGVEPLE